MSTSGAEQMILSDFVSESLKQIIAGIVEAQKSSSEHKATVNPFGLTDDHAGKLHLTNMGITLPRMIEFDIAVTATHASGSSGGLGIFVGGAAIGGKARAESSSESLSRIRFSVPVLLPGQHSTR